MRTFAAGLALLAVSGPALPQVAILDAARAVTGEYLQGGTTVVERAATGRAPEYLEVRADTAPSDILVIGAADRPGYARSVINGAGDGAPT